MPEELLTQRLNRTYEYGNHYAAPTATILEAKTNINRICKKYNMDIPFTDIVPDKSGLVSRALNWCIPQLEYVKRSSERGSSIGDCLSNEPVATSAAFILGCLNTLTIATFTAVTTYAPEVFLLTVPGMVLENRAYGYPGLIGADSIEREVKRLSSS